MATPPTPRLVSIVEPLYRLCLVAYPPAFRRAYGDLMAQVFGDCCQSAWRQGGAGGVLNLAARALLDLVSNAPAERIKEAWQMSPRTLLRHWAGPAAILGGLLWVWMLAGSRDFGDRGPLILVVLVPVLFLTGLAGLATRRLSWIGTTGLIASAVGVLVWVIGQLLWQDWMSFVGGFLLVSLGVLLVGVAALMTSSLARWSVVPLIIGLWPLVVQVTNPYSYEGADPTGWLGALQYVLFLTYGLGWMLLGYALRSSAGRTAPPHPLAME